MPKRYRDLVTRRSLPDAEDEKNILAFSIMNTNVAEAISRYYEDGQLKLKYLTPIYRRQYRSVLKYFKQYGKAPRRAIKFIHDGEKAKIKDLDELQLEEDLLIVLAQEYQARREGYSVSPQYVITEMIPRFLRARKVKDISDKIDMQLERGNVREAEDLISEYDVITVDPPDHTFGMIDTLSHEYQLEYYYRKLKEPSKDVFRFDGALDALIGPLKRQWLVSLSGTTKSGKSYFLLDLAISAAVYQKRNVMYFCPEMSEDDMNDERVIPWATNRAASKESAGVVYIPEFDCLNNQMNKCTANQRVKRGSKYKTVPLRTVNNNTPLTIFDERENVKEENQLFADSKAVENWEPCTICRNDRERYNYGLYKRFRPSIYYKPRTIKKVSRKVRNRAFKGLKQRGANGRLQIKYFPKYQLTIEDTFNIAKKYCDKNNWPVDIIIIDYVDVLKPTSGNKEMTWQDYDHMWKLSSGFAQEMDSLVISADQTTKAGRIMRTVDHTVTPQASTKDHHLDAKFAVNKFEEETLNNLCRVNIIYHRHRPFNRNLEVMLTQNLTCARAFLDSAFWYNKKMTTYPIKMPENYGVDL